MEDDVEVLGRPASLDDGCRVVALYQPSPAMEVGLSRGMRPPLPGMYINLPGHPAIDIASSVEAAIAYKPEHLAAMDFGANIRHDFAPLIRVENGREVLNKQFVEECQKRNPLSRNSQWKMLWAVNYVCDLAEVKRGSQGTERNRSFRTKAATFATCQELLGCDPHEALEKYQDELKSFGGLSTSERLLGLLRKKAGEKRTGHAPTETSKPPKPPRQKRDVPFEWPKWTQSHPVDEATPTVPGIEISRRHADGRQTVFRTVPETEPDLIAKVLKAVRPL